MRFLVMTTSLCLAGAAQAATVPVAMPAAAQPVMAAPVPAPAAPAMRELILAPNTEVVVTPNDTISSKSVKVGDKFRVTLMIDVMQDGVVLIPKGTPGEGTVTYQTGTGAFGKSGKLEIALNWLDLSGQRIALSGKIRSEGEGNTAAAVGAVVAVGVFGAFVKGHSANFVNGQELRGHTIEAVHLAVASAAPTLAVATPAAAVASPVPAVATVSPASAVATASPVPAVASAPAAAPLAAAPVAK